MNNASYLQYVPIFNSEEFIQALKILEAYVQN